MAKAASDTNINNKQIASNERINQANIQNQQAINDSQLANQRDINNQNIAFQRETNAQNMAWQREQFDYQKALNQAQMEREDTAIQRKIADARAAGVSALGALGASGAAASSMSSTSAAGVEAPQVQSSYNPVMATQQAAQLQQIGGFDTMASAAQNMEQSMINQRNFKAQLSQQFLFKMIDSYFNSRSADANDARTLLERDKFNLSKDIFEHQKVGDNLRNAYQRKLNQYATDNPNEVFGRDLSGLALLASLISGNNSTRNPVAALKDVVSSASGNAPVDTTSVPAPIAGFPAIDPSKPDGGYGPALRADAMRQSTTFATAFQFCDALNNSRSKALTMFEQSAYYKNLDSKNQKAAIDAFCDKWDSLYDRPALDFGQPKKKRSN